VHTPRCRPWPTGQLHLPWPEGESRRIEQAWNGKFSHQNQHAIDVGLALGEEVVAAAPGIVAQVVDDYDDNGAADDDKAFRSNYVEIDHGNGSFSFYEHLARNSAVVREGQRVAGGALLAKVGQSGYTTGPHLHFAIHNVRRTSQAFCFDDIAGGIPKAGNRYRSKNARGRVPGGLAMSKLDGDDLDDAGIRLLAPLPTRQFRRGSGVRLRGRTTVPGDEIRFQFAPDDRGPKLFIVRPIEPDVRGHFDIELPLPKRDGRYQFDVSARSSVRFMTFPFPVVVRSGRLPVVNVPRQRDGEWVDRYDSGMLSERGTRLGGKPQGLWTGWYDGGFPRYRGHFINGRPDGDWISWHDTGHFYERGQHRRGLRVGRWRTYDRQGNLVGDNQFEDGTGDVRLYHANGEAWISGRYQGGRRHGEWIEFHNNGVRKELRTYDHGELDGPWRKWYWAGRTELETRLLGGVLEGTYRAWHLDGSKSIETTMRGGEVAGTLEAWDWLGRVVVRAQFERGRIVESVYFDYGADGSVREIREGTSP
jgi:antitoxin component YwqK of YwqJK toxin-antitoxin module/murein DD-endopeptidase MepM/ murein hydrolase activator NlpD